MSYKVLLIDDDASFRKIVQMRVKAILGEVQFEQFGSLSEAREFLRSNSDTHFDLVVLDEHLPDGRGTEFLSEGWFKDIAVLSVSSDDAPEIPGASVLAGATFFLSKVSVSEALFKPLVLGIIDRNRIQRELQQSKITETILATVQTLVSTLRHEINNPLGAVLGAAYLIRTHGTATEQQKEAANLVESSGQRIKHVLDQLCEAVELVATSKANQKVFHIPGDKPWEDKG